MSTASLMNRVFDALEEFPNLTLCVASVPVRLEMEKAFPSNVKERTHEEAAEALHT